MSRFDSWMYTHRERYWRITCWLLEWLKPADAVVYLLTFTFYGPRWWGRSFDYFLDRGWL